MKFKVGDIVNCTVKMPGFKHWQNAKVVEIDVNDKKWPIRCARDTYPGESGLFSEDELELVNPE